MLEALKIVSFSILCAVAYGILHDLVTAHVSVEYFTIAHPPVFPTKDPLWLAIGWGVIATWWVGLILGTVLALFARVGSWPKLDLKSLKYLIAMLMIVSGALAIFSGLIGWALTQFFGSWTIGFWASEIEPGRHARFAFAAWAHSASYVVGGIGGVIVAARSLMRRKRAAD